MPVIRGNYRGKRVCRCGKPATTIVQYIEEAMELAMETIHPVRVMCRPCAKREVAPTLGLNGAAREIPGTVHGRFCGQDVHRQRTYGRFSPAIDSLRGDRSGTHEHSPLMYRK